MGVVALTWLTAVALMLTTMALVLTTVYQPLAETLHPGLISEWQRAEAVVTDVVAPVIFLGVGGEETPRQGLSGSCETWL